MTSKKVEMPKKDHKDENNNCQQKDAPKSLFDPKYSAKITDADIMNQFKNAKPMFGNSEKKEKNSETSENESIKAEKKVEETIPLCFEKEASIFKFKETWIGCGTGTVCITEDRKRIYFMRHGISLTAFDFLMNFDMKPERKNKDVIFNGVSFDDVESKPALTSFALRFFDEKSAVEFEKLLKTTGN